MKVGIVGLGEMGGGMMDRLILAGRSPAGHNRTKAKAQAYIDKGMEWADSPRALAERCDVVLSMVTDDAALTAIAEGEQGILAGLSSGKIWVEMSTVAPAAIRALGDKVKATSAELLDAAVLGSPLTIQQGKLLIIAGGDEPTFERARPALLDIGPTVKRVGEIGHAKVMKVALNLNLPLQILALSEGVLLAEKSGIPREVALDIMLGGVVASPMLAYRAPFILRMPEKAWFDVGMMQKDVNLALGLGRQVEVPMPLTAIANEMCSASRAMGFGEYDFAVLFHTLARFAGIDSSPQR
ncbi:MAG: NAD(P)-dependent oxidoreductase [Candidatus Eremiobacteraeota bacterium]|nr:NAD(P)-dependent oxidoreductase [Candidatus Eremiobacteraeota bacterium]